MYQLNVDAELPDMLLNVELVFSITFLHLLLHRCLLESDYLFIWNM